MVKMLHCPEQQGGEMTHSILLSHQVCFTAVYLLAAGGDDYLEPFTSSQGGQEQTATQCLERTNRGTRMISV